MAPTDLLSKDQDWQRAAMKTGLLLLIENDNHFECLRHKSKERYILTAVKDFLNNLEARFLYLAAFCVF